MCLVIFHHVAIAYGGEGLFIIASSTKGTDVFNLGATAILAINQSFFMGMFFVVSSYFSYKSLIKKSKKEFILGKVKRLLVPALVYYFIVSPLISLVIDIVYLNIPFSELKYRPEIGPLWFVLVLFLFDTIFAVLFIKKQTVNTTSVPLYKKSILWVAIIGVISWVVRFVSPVGYTIPRLAFQLSHFPQYIFAYIIGIMASRNNWLEVFDTRSKKVLWYIVPIVISFLGSIGVVISITGSIQQAFGGFNVVSLLYCIWEQLMFITLLYGSVALFKERLNYKNRLLKFMGNASFIAYIAHSAVIVLVVILLSLFKINHIISFCIAAISSIVISFVVGNLLKPVLKL